MSKMIGKKKIGLTARDFRFLADAEKNVAHDIWLGMGDTMPPLAQVDELRSAMASAERYLAEAAEVELRATIEPPLFDESADDDDAV